MTNWKQPEHFDAEAYWKIIFALFHGDVDSVKPDADDIDEVWTKVTFDCWNNACFGVLDPEADYAEPIVPSTWDLVKQQRRAAKSNSSRSQSPRASGSSTPAPESNPTSDPEEPDLERLANHGT